MEMIFVVSWMVYSLLVWMNLLEERSSVAYKVRGAVGWLWVTLLYWIGLLGLVEPDEEVYVILAMLFFVLLCWPQGGK